MIIAIKETPVRREWRRKDFFGGLWPCNFEPETFFEQKEWCLRNWL